MRQLYKTSDVIRFLVNYDCLQTADSFKRITDGAEFVDSKLVQKHLIKELYAHLEFETNRYTYKN